MDTEVEYRTLWKMSLGQVTGSLAMVALGIVDVIIKAEKCSGGHHYMPGFCLAMAIWLPAFLLLIALLSFTIGPEKGENHDKLVLVDIGCCLLGILLCIALVGWSILNISHTVDLEMPTEKGYSTILVPCFVIPLSLVVAIFMVFNINSAFKLLRLRAGRKIKPIKVRMGDETVKVIEQVPWWQKLGRQSAMSVHSSLVSDTISFHSELSIDCEHTPGGHCTICDDLHLGRSISASVLESRRHTAFRRSSIPAIYGIPDSMADFHHHAERDESLYESIDPSRWLSLKDNHQITYNKPPKLPRRNKKRVDPNVLPLKPVVHTHRFHNRVHQDHNRVHQDRRKSSAQEGHKNDRGTLKGQSQDSSAPRRGKRKQSAHSNKIEEKDDEIFAISRHYPRPVSRVHPLRHPAGRRNAGGQMRAPPSLNKSPQRSNQTKSARRTSQTLSNSITIIRVDNLETVSYDV